MFCVKVRHFVHLSTVSTCSKPGDLVSMRSCVVSAVMGERMLEKLKIVRHPVIKFKFGFLFSLGRCSSSWRAETKMFSLKLRRPTAVSLKPELRKAAACALSLSPPPHNTLTRHKENFTHLGCDVRCVCFYYFALEKCDEAVFDFRYCAKTATHTHTCAEVIWCEKQRTCF